MKTIKSIIIISILISGFIPKACLAEFICKGEVQYKWRAATSDNLSTKSNTAPLAQATPQPSSSEEQGVFWAVVERKGATEEEAKRSVVDASIPQRSAADKACRLQHENLTSCVANKFTSLSSTLNSLTFSARRSLEEAVTSDCNKQQGTCLPSVVSDPICIEKKTEEAPPEGGDKAEKDKGKKEKKK